MRQVTDALIGACRLATVINLGAADRSRKTITDASGKLQSGFSGAEINNACYTVTPSGTLTMASVPEAGPSALPGITTDARFTGILEWRLVNPFGLRRNISCKAAVLLDVRLGREPDESGV